MTVSMEFRYSASGWPYCLQMVLWDRLIFIWWIRHWLFGIYLILSHGFCVTKITYFFNKVRDKDSELFTTVVPIAYSVICKGCHFTHTRRHHSPKIRRSLVHKTILTQHLWVNRMKQPRKMMLFACEKHLKASFHWEMKYGSIKLV
jgi:hypothetical protein